MVHRRAIVVASIAVFVLLALASYGIAHASLPPAYALVLAMLAIWSAFVGWSSRLFVDSRRGSRGDSLLALASIGAGSAIAAAIFYLACMVMAGTPVTRVFLWMLGAAVAGAIVAPLLGLLARAISRRFPTPLT